MLYGFRLDRIGARPTKGKPDRRAWLLMRVMEGNDDQHVNVTAVTPLAPVTPGKRAPGFVACFDAEVEGLNRLELPSW